ncbi:MAG: hypothetical protein EP318_04640 [Rhodobacteraceae bacterium]|nr:MAG: hypothetical protein EP318_04640 [Paracoccaceae bacterium]
MIVALGLLIAFVLVLIFSRPATRNCRWREYPRGAESDWRCAFCGAATTGPRGRKPRTCHRDRG